MATARQTKPAEIDADKVASAKSAKPVGDEADEAKKSDATYSEQAAKLGNDARELAEEIREELVEFGERIAHLRQAAPGQGDAAAGDGVNRLPMAIAAVQTALDGLVHVAADLAVKAQQSGA